MTTARWRSSMARGWLPRLPAFAWLAVVASLAATLLTWRLSLEHARSRSRALFDREAERVELSIRERMLLHETVLQSARALFQASDDVTEDEWRRFVLGHSIEKSTTGMKGLAFARSLSRSDLPAFLREVRSEEDRSYTIAPPGVRESYVPVRYIEPEARYRLALGLDLATRPHEREAMERARDTGLPSLTAPLILGDAFGGARGIFTFLAVYENGFPTATVEQRRKALRGFVVAPLELAEFFAGALTSRIPGIQIELHDGTSGLHEALVLDGDHAPPVNSGEQAPAHLRSLALSQGGRTWLLTLSTGREFDTLARHSQPGLALIGGLLCTGLLFVTLLLLSRGRARAEVEAALSASSYRASAARSRLLALVAARTRDAVLITDAEGHVEWVNDGFTRLFGYNLEEVRAAGLTGLLEGPDVDRELVGWMRRQVEAGQGFQAETLGYRKDGAPIWLDLNVQTDRNETGEATHFVALAADVTSLKRAEEALRKSEESYRSAADSVREVLFQTDSDGRFTFLNPAWEELTGIPVQDALGQTCEAFVAMGDRDRHHREFGRLLGGVADSCRQDVSLVRKNGDIRPVEFRAHRHLDDSGRPSGTSGTLADVGDREEETALLTGQKRVLELVATGAPLQEVLDTLSLVAERRIAGSLCSVLLVDESGSDLVDFSAPSLPKAYRESIGRVPIGPSAGSCGTAAHRRERVIVADIASDPLWAHYRDLALPYGVRACWSEPILSRGGRVLGTFAMYYREPRTPAETDVRLIEASAQLASIAIERHHEEADLAAARDQAIEAARTNSQFLANVSHEIRVPLNAVLGMTELTLETDLSPRQRGYLETVRVSGQQLLHLLNDILDFSKVEAGKLSLESLSFDLRDLLEDTLASLFHQARQKGLGSACEVADDVPQRVTGDPGRLRQVLLNLVGNAIRFTPRGTIRVRVVMDGVEGELVHLRFGVADTGMGIPREKQSAIFRSFTQPDTSTGGTQGGTGLGLAICWELVRLMGGRIWLESQPGAGSLFQFTTRMGLDPGGASVAHAVPDGSRRLLLAEDNSTGRSLTTWRLERLGHSVFAVANAVEAIESLELEAFDAVLIDRFMPGVDGLTAAARIREAERKRGGRIRIVILAPNVTDQDREKAVESGADAVLTKPIATQDLTSALGAAAAVESVTAVGGRGAAASIS